MEPSRPDFLLILRTLSAHNVEFIIVGGVCGVLHGAPISTFDLDLVHSRTQENVERLLKALKELETRYRDLAGRTIRPTREKLSSAGHQLLLTRCGPLDLLGEIGQHRDYNALIPNTVTIEMSDGLRVRVLTLEALIREKEDLSVTAPAEQPPRRPTPAEQLPRRPAPAGYAVSFTD
jgi:hypothetical protein